MNAYEEQLLSDFESQLDQLIRFCDSLKTENANLKREIAQKEDSIRQLIFSNEQLKKKYNNLQLASTLSTAHTDEDASKQAKDRLAKLVQDVDKCIAMLKS